MLRLPTRVGRHVTRRSAVIAIAGAATLVVGTSAVAALATGASGPATGTTAQTSGTTDPNELSRRHEIDALLAGHYYRPIDKARLATVPVDQIPAYLGDPYTHYLDPQALSAFISGDDGSYAGIGIGAHLEDQAVVLDDISPKSPAAEAGLRVGDILISADGKPVSGSDLEVALANVRGPIDTVAHLVVRRAGETLTRDVRRRQVTAQVVTAQLRQTASGTVGYVRVIQFDHGTGERTRQAVQDLRRRGAGKIVLDLRHNGGGLVSEAVALTSVFTPTGTDVLSESGEHFPTADYRTHDAPEDTQTPLAVLVDDQTASAAEITTAALRDAGRATILGTKTFGKGVVQDVLDLRDGGALKYTMAEYVTPRGDHVNHVGLTPDVVVASAFGRSDVDPAFDAAVQRLTTPVATPADHGRVVAATDDRGGENHGGGEDHGGEDNSGKGGGKGRGDR